MLPDGFGVLVMSDVPNPFDGGAGGTIGVPATGVSVEMISVACDCCMVAGMATCGTACVAACETACDCAADCSEATLLRARLCLRALSACIASYWNVSLSISDSGLFAELEITIKSVANM